jgi:hypothetical protein
MRVSKNNFRYLVKGGLMASLRIDKTIFENRNGIEKNLVPFCLSLEFVYIVEF